MPDHDLRLLVGHANLLDSLMLELADAEREQESWFNQSVRSASQSTENATADNKHIQWADTINEADEEDYEDSSSDEDSDDSDLSEDDEDVDMADAVSLRRVPSHNDMKAPASPQLAVIEIEMDDEDDEDYAELTLTRSPSHHSAPASPLPELEHDFEESSEDEAMPPSPPSTMLPTFESSKQQTEEDEEQQQKRVSEDFYDDHNTIHYMPPRNPARLVSAISVY